MNTGAADFCLQHFVGAGGTGRHQREQARKGKPR
jgi:hypothetical protein